MFWAAKAVFWAMDFAANFTAIDFETANRRPDSACQLAAVRVRDGRIVDSAMWMIRPKPFYFSRANIQIHGIHPHQVEHEPDFGDVWPQVQRQFGSDCLVAHNASFDIGVLRACLVAHHHPIPEMHFTCTRAIARRTWPHRRRYGLKPLAEWLGIRFQHHDALQDSVACAKILLAAGIDADAVDLEDLERRLRLGRGIAGPDGQRAPGRRGRQRKPAGRVSSNQPPLPFHWPANSSPQPAATSESELDLQRLMVRAELIRPLSGRSIVFSGRLRSLSPQQAESLATRLGGKCQTSVTEVTDFVVVGSTSRRVGPAAPANEIEQEAQRLHEAGADIRILSEDDFLGLVISPATCES